MQKYEWGLVKNSYQAPGWILFSENLSVAAAQSNLTELSLHRDIMCFEKSPLAKSQDNHFRKNLKFLFVVVDIWLFLFLFFKLASWQFVSRSHFFLCLLLLQLITGTLWSSRKERFLPLPCRCTMPDFGCKDPPKGMSSRSCWPVDGKSL